MRGSTRDAVAAGLLWVGLLGAACAQSIYACVDAHGRHLTADRPIPECMGREQTVFKAGGTIKSKIGPSLTAQERAAQEDKARKAAEERNRLAEEKRRDRALLARYPNRRTHDKERASAIALADEAIAAAVKNTDGLVASRKRLDTELEFYRNDPSKVPANVKRQIQENEQHIEAQRRFVANQDSEKRRINAQFDDELARLKLLWARPAAPAAATAVVPAPAGR